MVILTPIENKSLQIFFKTVYRDLWGYLNQNCHKIVDRTHKKKDDALIRWPPCSPDFTPWDFLFWGFVPPLAANLRDLRNHITAAVALVNRDMLARMWDIA
jgi:hypothetical protein